MAILLRGKTKCPICGDVIAERDKAVTFPQFILNEKDPLFTLSDAACHIACVSADPLGLEMLAAADEYYKNTGPGKRVCVVCGNQVLDADDYLLIGYLGNPSANPLAKFSYTHLHKSHIRDWKQAGKFLTLARAAIDSGQWKGNVLPDFIRTIEIMRGNGGRVKTQ